MSRWPVRILGVVLLLVFAVMFMQMYKTLVTLQREQQQSAPAR